MTGVRFELGFWLSQAHLEPAGGSEIIQSIPAAASVGTACDRDHPTAAGSASLMKAYDQISLTQRNDG
jgi:hypothetical protein